MKLQDEKVVINIDAPDNATRRFAFLLMKNFTLLSFASAVDSLRIANRMSDKAIYSWVFLSEDGNPVSCSAGTSFNVDNSLIDLHRDDTIMVCGGMNISETTTKPILNWIRKETRRGLKIGGLCTAAYTLARAGILDGKRATTHWENQDSF